MANSLRATYWSIGLLVFLASGASIFATENNRFAYYGQEEQGESLPAATPEGAMPEDGPPTDVLPLVRQPRSAGQNESQDDEVPEDRAAWEPAKPPTGFPRIGDVRDPRYRWPDDEPFSQRAGSFRYNTSAYQPFAASLSQGNGLHARPRGEPGGCQEYSIHGPPKRFSLCREWLSWRECDDHSCGCGGPGKGNCNSCGDGACGQAHLACFQPYPGLWYTRVEAAALRRDTDLEFVAAKVGANGARRLATTDVCFPYAIVGSFTLGRYLDECNAIEGNYTGYGHWVGFDAARNNTVNSFGGVGNLTSPFTNFGQPLTVGFDGANFVQLDNAAHYQSFELNLLHRLDTCCGPMQAWFIYGGRYLDIREALSYRAITDRPLPGGTTNAVTSVARNDMAGLQVGLLTQTLASPCCWFDFEGKAGIYSNAARVQRDYTFTDPTGANTLFANSGKRHATAVVGDLKLTSNYMISQNATLRLGYMATFVGGVATGNGNMPADVGTLQGGPVRVNSGSTNIYHGPVTGFTFVW